jgi:hypothetical protein
MAFTSALVKRRKWIGLIGLALQVVAFFLRSRAGGLALAFFGLGLCFLALKDLYDNSESRKTESYELFPKRARTP